MRIRGDDRYSAISVAVRLCSASATPPGPVSLAHDSVARGSVLSLRRLIFVAEKNQ